MDLLELSDDELDYELGDAVDVISVTNYSNNKTQVTTVHDDVSQTNNEKFVASKLGNRKRKKIMSLPETEVSTSGTEFESCDEGSSNIDDHEDDSHDEMLNLSGRLAGRVKRVMNKYKEIGFEDENFGAERFAAILDHGRKNRRNLKDNELENLYNSLDIDPDDSQFRLNALYVKGTIEKMNTFDISRIFAEYKPETVRPISESAFIITFPNALDVAQLLLEMSKPLRRVRKPKKLEEGELMDSSEEDEGQVKEEGGEDIAIIKGGHNRVHRANCDVVEVDIESAKVPSGKWRVITNHVPDSKLIFVRIATGYELRCSIFATKEEQRDSFNYRHTKIRPGLNVFDEKGNELDWDYEHDTRFFENIDEAKGNGTNANQTEEAATTSQPQQTETTVIAAGMKIRSRGRGAKKFLQAFKDSDDDE